MLRGVTPLPAVNGRIRCVCRALQLAEDFLEDRPSQLRSVPDDKSAVGLPDPRIVAICADQIEPRFQCQDHSLPVLLHAAAAEVPCPRGMEVPIGRQQRSEGSLSCFADPRYFPRFCKGFVKTSSTGTTFSVDLVPSRSLEFALDD